MAPYPVGYVELHYTYAGQPVMANLDAAWKVCQPGVPGWDDGTCKRRRTYVDVYAERAHFRPGLTTIKRIAEWPDRRRSILNEVSRGAYSAHIYTYGDPWSGSGFWERKSSKWPYGYAIGMKPFRDPWP